MDINSVIGSAVIAAFVSAACSAFTAMIVAKRTAFINTVTSERVKWIQKVRENVSRFVGLTHTWLRSEEDEAKRQALTEEIDVLRYHIKLQMNPESTLDMAIIEKIDKIPNLASRPGDIFPVHQAMDELIEATQKMLKEEWEKVKGEAKRGDLA